MRRAPASLLAFLTLPIPAGGRAIFRRFGFGTS